VYATHLRPGGVLAIHISNRYLDLAPVAISGTLHLGWVAAVIRGNSDPVTNAATNTWVVTTSDATLFDSDRFDGTDSYPLSDPQPRPWWRPAYRDWTDDDSNLLSLLRF
jgi:hypothetical protein